MIQRVGNTVGPIDFSDPFGYEASTSSGLTWGFRGGDVLDEGVLTVIADGTLTLGDNSTNIVYIDYSGTPAMAVTTINNRPSQTDSVFVYIVQTAGGAVSSQIDLRNWTMSKITL